MDYNDLNDVTKNHKKWSFSMSQPKHYPILIEMDEDGFYIVSCPSFKGCRSYGSSIDEALRNIREAIELCLEDEPAEEQNVFIGFRELEVSGRA